MGLFEVWWILLPQLPQSPALLFICFTYKIFKLNLLCTCSARPRIVSKQCFWVFFLSFCLCSYAIPARLCLHTLTLCLSLTHTHNLPRTYSVINARRSTCSNNLIRVCRLFMILLLFSDDCVVVCQVTCWCFAFTLALALSHSTVHALVLPMYTHIFMLL